MPTLEIDGVGKVQVDNSFLGLSPEQKAAEVEAIANAIRPPPPVTAATAAPGSEEAEFLAQQPQPEDIKKRGAILPAGRTQEGTLTAALPEFLEGPRRAIMDLIEGRRTADQITGKEMFEIGALMSPMSAARGTSMGVSRAAATKQAEVPARIEPPMTAETIVGPAIQFQGKSYTGTNHIDAIEVAATEHGLRPMDVIAAIRTNPNATDGFLTSSGRYVNRTAARSIAEQSSQISKGTSGELISHEIGGQSKPPVTFPSHEAVAPTTAAGFKDAAKPFYKAADDAGIVFKPEAISDLRSKIFTAAAKEGLDPTLTPKSFAAMKRIDDAVGEPITWTTFDILDRIVGIAKGAIDRDDARIAMDVIGPMFDDFIRNLKPADLLHGDPKILSQVVTRADNLWSKGRKLETIESMVDRAQTSAGGYAASGFENALRTEFRALAKNANKLRKFTPDEQRAIKHVARIKAGQTIARQVGKLSPSSGVMGAFLGGAVGHAVGGIPGVIATAAVGESAKRLATAMIKRNIDNLTNTIRAGGSSQAAQASIDRATGLLELLSERSAVAKRSSIPADALSKRNQDK